MISTVILTLSHFLGDWIFQSRQMAREKSSKINTLIEHVCIWTLCVTIPFLFIPYIYDIKINNLLYFVLTNFILHLIQDWNIWKLYKYSVIKRNFDVKTFEWYNDYWFYTFIAIDQSIHLTILFVTYQYFLI